MAAVNRRHDALNPEVGFMVAQKRCNECLYSTNKIVPDERRKELLALCKKKGKYFLCHKGTIAGSAVVCRGFYDEQSNTACQIAGRLGLTVFVDPESPPKAEAKKRKTRA